MAYTAKEKLEKLLEFVTKEEEQRTDFSVKCMDKNVITYLACICFIFLFGKLFIVPLKKILKILCNSILGGIVIYIINLIGASFNFHIGLNFLTSILIWNVRVTWSCMFNNYKASNWVDS